MHWVEMLPDTQTPSWLGLPSNAEKVLLTTQGTTRPMAPIMGAGSNHIPTRHSAISLGGIHVCLGSIINHLSTFCSKTFRSSVIASVLSGTVSLHI